MLCLLSDFGRQPSNIGYIYARAVMSRTPFTSLHFTYKVEQFSFLE